MSKYKHARRNNRIATPPAKWEDLKKEFISLATQIGNTYTEIMGIRDTFNIILKDNLPYKQAIDGVINTLNITSEGIIESGKKHGVYLYELRDKIIDNNPGLVHIDNGVTIITDHALFIKLTNEEFSAVAGTDSNIVYDNFTMVEANGHYITTNKSLPMFSFKNGRVKNDDMETYIALQTRYIVVAQSIMEIWSTVCMDILPTLLGTNEHSKEIEAIVGMARSITTKIGATND